jgi:8-oxo-dGTP pyrophosphatase MutT (NUDIX family)
MYLECGERLYRLVCCNMGKLEALSNADDTATQAAVAITIVDVCHGPDIYGLPSYRIKKKDASIILTRRAHRLKNHAGQWALPGGRLDDGESPEEAALRELGEEVGLDLNPDRVIGRLDDFRTRSGFNITPIVIWGGPNVTLTPNPDEVASIHRIPIDEFLRKDAPVLQEIPQSPNPVLLMPVGHSWIAAPTAAMIYQFREVAILGKTTRVSHYEQPLFAWN